jgi:hypothetical protein
MYGPEVLDFLREMETATEIACRPGRLTGQEVRWLRKYAGLSARQLASQMECTIADVARAEWCLAPLPSERAFRLRFVPASKRSRVYWQLCEPSGDG